MIQHVCSCAANCRDISDVYVTTDDERIFKCVEDFGGKAVMTKEKHPSGTDRIAEAVEKLGLSSEDIIVNIQGDQPVFEPSVISEMVKPLLNDETIPMSTLKYRINNPAEIDNSNIVKVVTDNGNFLKQKTMKFFEEHLDPKDFLRIHRSYIIRLKFMKQIELFKKDSYKVILVNGEKLPVSKSGYSRLKEILK